MQPDEKPDVTATVEFQLGAWTLRPTSNELLRDGKIVQIEPKVMALLVYLVQRADQVISREQLFNALWPGVYVGDDPLTQVVIKLRKALGDNAKSPRYVQTIPKMGYRLTAAVDAAPPVGSPAQTSG